MNVDFSWPTSIDTNSANGVIALYNDAIKSTTILGYTEQLDADSGTQLVEDLRNALKRREKFLLTIRVNQDLVGMALLTTSKMPNCRHIGELSKGIIRSDHRGAGLLRAAMKEIVRHCEQQQIELIVLDAREHSRPHKLWLNFGFREYGRLEDYARVDGVPDSGVFLYQSTADLKAFVKRTKSTSFMNKETFRERLRGELESRITLTHPIIKKIIEGEPHWDLLRYTTLQGYQLTKHFLEYISTLHHHCPPGEHKRRLLFNMFEEETGRFSRTDNHVTLMEKFIRAIGIRDHERNAMRPLPSTKALIDYRMNLVSDRRRFHMGAAAVMIASEGQNLETVAGEARHDLLPRIYNLKEEDLLFFSVHQKEDVGHVREGINLVADICNSFKMQQEALDAVRRTCDLFHCMYDGIAEVFADCPHVSEVHT